MLNLLDNAAKWSPPGGRVGVRLTQIDPVHAELVVFDFGPGIPPQERALVFERFYRSTSARAMPGSGLGLAIVAEIAAQHQATIALEDANLRSRSPASDGTAPFGPGARFTVRFPAAPPAAGQSRSSAGGQKQTDRLC